MVDLVVVKRHSAEPRLERGDSLVAKLEITTVRRSSIGSPGTLGRPVPTGKSKLIPDEVLESCLLKERWFLGKERDSFDDDRCIEKGLRGKEQKAACKKSSKQSISHIVYHQLSLLLVSFQHCANIVQGLPDWRPYGIAPLSPNKQSTRRIPKARPSCLRRSCWTMHFPAQGIRCP